MKLLKIDAMKCNTCVLPIAYLPPIEFFSVLKHCDKILLEKFENYPKQTYRNRCYIYSPNGKQALTIPVSKGDMLKMHTADISIVHRENWNLKNWRAIETAYNNSPYFLYYKDELMNIHNSKEVNLFKYNMELIKVICSFLNLDANKIEPTTEYLKKYSTGVEDYRELMHPKKRHLFNPNKSSKYFQVFECKYGFIYNLSILDLLFNEGPQSELYIDKLAKNTQY